MFGLFCVVACLFLIVAAFSGGDKKELVAAKVKEQIPSVINKFIPVKVDTTTSTKKTAQYQKKYEMKFKEMFKAVKQAVANGNEKIPRLRDSLSWTLDKPTDYDYIAPITKTN